MRGCSRGSTWENEAETIKGSRHIQFSRKLSEREICRLVRDAGWTPVQRDQYYNVPRRHDGADSPDLRPLDEPPVPEVRRIDKEFIGKAPGIDEGADESVKVQLPILGGSVDGPRRGRGG
jgi:hypothetical protein